MPSPSAPTRKLREHPDLDQLKRQAKELLAAFVAGEHAAVAEVNAHCRGADRAAFALHDAQLVLSRAYGFDSWPKLKAFVDGATIRRLAAAVEHGDQARVRAMLKARPELVNFDMSENDERRPIHYAIFNCDAVMVRLLMSHGADARKGIYPYREATSALTIAVERGYGDIVAIIGEEEQRRHDALATANQAASPQPKPAACTSPSTTSPSSTSSSTGTEAADVLAEIILDDNDELAIAKLEADPHLIHDFGRRGWTPLHLATAMLNKRLVRWLLDHGAQPNVRGKRGKMPLDLADGRGWRRASGLENYRPVVDLLIERGAEVTPRTAIALGAADWIRKRRAAGELTNPIEGPGGLLSFAVRHDRPEMLQLLLDLGFDPDERKRIDDVEDAVFSWGMPLHHCAGLGKLEMARMLLERGADANGQVYASGSVMYSALHAKDMEMAALLESYGGFADAATVGHLRMTDKARQMFADHDAGRLPQGSYMAVNGTLAQEMLWAGLRGGDPEIVRMSLERVAWPRDHSEWHGKLWSPLPGYQPRSIEDHCLYLECFRQVLERCDPNVRHPKFERSVLHEVAASDEAVSPQEALDFATLLLDAGATLDVRDSLLKSTPLGWACRWGRLELVKLFMDRGADVIEADAEPWATPRAWAEKMGREDVLQILRK